MLAAASMRKIRTFMNNAVEDPKSGDLYVERKIRTGEHATTNNPAGAVEDTKAKAPDRLVDLAMIDDPPPQK